MGDLERGPTSLARQKKKKKKKKKKKIILLSLVSHRVTQALANESESRGAETLSPVAMASEPRSANEQTIRPTGSLFERAVALLSEESRPL